jgi:AcrR family transcriptional regulator
VDRRSELTEGALAYVLANGLIGLSLRPLAAELGTSDRMLIYHFGDKDGLVAEILALANRGLAESINAAERPVHGVADLVRHTWQVLTATDTTGMVRLYLEMCVLSVGEPDRWSAAHRRLREPWLGMLRTGLAELDVAAPKVPALADLILDAIDGLLLDRLVSGHPDRADAAAAAFAELLEPLDAGPSG